MGFISNKYFSNYDTAISFYNQLRGGYNCIGAIQPPVRSADRQFVVTVKADGPRVDEDGMKTSRWLFVEVTRKYLFPNPMEVKISTYYTKQLEHMVRFFKQIEDRRLRVVTDQKQYGFSFTLGPQRQSKRDRYPEEPQIVFTEFTVDEVEPRTLSPELRQERKTNHWKGLAKAIRNINEELNLEMLSKAEMDDLLAKIESGADVDEILGLPIFVVPKKRITYITDKLHPTMKANPSTKFWSEPLDGCFRGFEHLEINHPLLHQVFEEEENDAIDRGVRVVEFSPKDATNEEKKKTQQLYDVINSFRNSIDHLGRSRLNGQIPECLKEDYDLYHLFELAFPNHFQLLYTNLPVKD